MCVLVNSSNACGLIPGIPSFCVTVNLQLSERNQEGRGRAFSPLHPEILQSLRSIRMTDKPDEGVAEDRPPEISETGGK